MIFFSPLFYSVFFKKAVWEDSIVIYYISFVFDTISRMISSEEDGADRLARCGLGGPRGYSLRALRSLDVCLLGRKRSPSEFGCTDVVGCVLVAEVWTQR